MNFQDLIQNAKQNIGPYCKICTECNGIACRGKIPGPGGKGTGLGFIRNYQDLKKICLKMDTIYAPQGVSTEVEIFGKKFSAPIFVAPIGGVAMHYSQAYNDFTYSEAVLEGSLAAGTFAFTGDCVQDAVFKETMQALKKAKGCGIPTIKPWSLKEVLERLRLVEDAGAFAFAMDIDAAGLAILAMQGKPVAPMSSADLRKISESTKLPFILKGIMTVEGAKKALEAKAQGIIVSNHGGRVLDETPSTIEVLPEIIKAVGDKMTVLIDGGFRSGLDVYKALALGAKGVLIARPFASAVYGGGAEGVKIYHQKLQAELKEAMVMTGASKLQDINTSKISFLRS